MDIDLLKDLCKIRWEYILRTSREKWGKLTEPELADVAGDYDKLVKLLQEKYGYSPERAAEEVQQCISPYVRVDA